jgi:polysaccharide biosynthesis/export protein
MCRSRTMVLGEHMRYLVVGLDVVRPGFFALLALLALTVTITMGACATERPFVWVQDLPPANSGEAKAVIQARDTIVVHVRDQPTMTGEFVVRDDGGYLQPMLGNVNVDRRTPADVGAELQGRLESLIVKPQVTVSIARAAPVRVNVVGEVKTPGVYELTRDRTVMGALAAGGWLTPFAAKDRIFVVRPGDKEVRVRFRTQELTAPEPRSPPFHLRDGDVVVVE